jgi:hypothetical protein
LTLIAALSLGCFIFGSPNSNPEGSDATSGNCMGDPATDPSEVNQGDLQAELGHQRWDRDAERYVFEPLDDANPTYDFETAGQGGGGYHISPAVLVRNPGAPENEAVVNFQVRDPDSGEAMTNIACDQGELSLWGEVPEGRLFGGMRVIFAVPQSRASGTRELIADIQVGDRRKVLKRTVELQ